MGLFRKKNDVDIRKKILRETKEIDYSEIVEGFFKGKDLYEELRVMSHPDRYANTEKEQRATELFKLVQDNRGNYRKMLEIKEMIYKELND